MKSLTTAFNEVYGEALKEYGFKKIKGKYPYYARLVGDEIVQVITLATRPKQKGLLKEYIILGGVASVYRPYINLNASITHNLYWMDCLLEFYTKSNPYMEPDVYKEAFKKWYSISYKEDSEEDLMNSMRISLEDTKHVILPVLDNVIDIKSCFEYYKRNIPFILGIKFDENFEKLQCEDESNEGLINFVLFDEMQFQEVEKVYLSKTIEIIRYKAQRDGINGMEQVIIENEKMVLEKIDKFKYIIDNKLDEVKDELERRKQFNTGLLKQYGLI